MSTTTTMAVISAEKADEIRGLPYWMNQVYSPIKLNETQYVIDLMEARTLKASDILEIVDYSSPEPEEEPENFEEYES